MDEAIATIRAKNKDRDVVLSFFKRLDDLKKELIKAKDELKLMRTDELSHFNDAAQEELTRTLPRPRCRATRLKTIGVRSDPWRSRLLTSSRL